DAALPGATRAPAALAPFSLGISASGVSGSGPGRLFVSAGATFDGCRTRSVTRASAEPTRVIRSNRTPVATIVHWQASFVALAVGGITCLDLRVLRCVN